MPPELFDGRRGKEVGVVNECHLEVLISLPDMTLQIKVRGPALHAIGLHRQAGQG